MKLKNKGFVLAIGAILLVLGGFLLGWASRGNRLPVPTQTLVPTPSSTSGIFKVTRVIDGDTIEIEGGEHVRYIGIDTPETVDPRKPVQCFGKEAREAKQGLWGACPVVSPTVSSQETSKPERDIKGNISTSGEKIYHLSGCGSYAKTQIDESRGERWFCSEEEAQMAGWHKALNCP